MTPTPNTTITRNIKRRQGEDERFGFTITKGGVPLDLSGAKALMQLRKSASDEKAALSLTEADGITFGKDGGTVSIPGVRTRSIAYGSYYYDLFVLVGGVVYVPVAGTYQLLDAVTDTQVWDAP